MMIAFDNRIPDSFMLEQLLEQDINYLAGANAPNKSFFPANEQDRYIAVYEGNQLVGFGHLSLSGQANPAEASMQIFVSADCRKKDLKQTIYKLLHARKYSRSS